MEQCWFCEDNLVSMKDDNTYKLYKEISRNDGMTKAEVKFHSMNVTIYRCSDCNKKDIKNALNLINHWAEELNHNPLRLRTFVEQVKEGITPQDFINRPEPREGIENFIYNDLATNFPIYIWYFDETTFFYPELFALKFN